MDREILHLDKLLIRKQKHLEKLELSPVTELTQQQFRYRESLREEIKLMAGLLLLINSLGEAYMDETARMAGLYWGLWANDQLKQRLIQEQQTELDKVRKEVVFWINLYHEQIKKQLTNHV